MSTPDDVLDYDDDDDDDDFIVCDHDHDEECYDYQGFLACHHQHCWNCGGCGCPGYCDDYQTYNMRPDETGGASGADLDDSRDTPDRTPLGESSW